MQMHNNTDNAINYALIDLKLRKINDSIYDSIVQKFDGYYCRIVCGYKPYDQNHTYGEENVVHNGLYMIYPLPQNEIKEYKLESFTPPKLLDGNSLITVDSFNSTNPHEFTIKVPIDRRYMASKEYMEGTEIFLKARDDRNHNKKIQFKEIWNNTSNTLGETSLDNTNFIELNQYSYLETNIYKNTLITGVASVSVKDNQVIVGKSWGKSYLDFDLSKFQLKKVKISCYVTKNVSVGWYFRPDKNGASSTVPAAEGALFESNWCPIGEKVKYEKILTIPENAKYIHIEGQDCIYEDICISILEGYKTPQIELPRPLQPNEIYSWDEYRKHYVIKKNVKEELYQNYTNKSFIKVGYRYVRETINGANSSNTSDWCEIEIWANEQNICKSIKPVVTCSSNCGTKNFDKLFDGVKSGTAAITASSGVAWVQIDLLDIYPIDQIKIWHWIDNRICKDVKLECSIDGTEWDTIYNNETPYNETVEGKTHDVDTVQISTVINNKTSITQDCNKILVAKQLFNEYSIVFKNDNNELSTEKFTMRKADGINKTAYFNIVDVPLTTNNVEFQIPMSDENEEDAPILYENFGVVKEFNGRINDSGILVSDDTTKSYYFKINTNGVFDLFVKGGDILRIGVSQGSNEVGDGIPITGVKNYTEHITEDGIYLHVDLKDYYPIRDVDRYLVINTNSIGTVDTNPCTELFVITSTINLHQNYLYDEIEYCKDNNEIIEIDFAKIKDYEEPYTDAITINDWIINEDSIIKMSNGKTYSALILCNPKDNFKVIGNSIEQFAYAYLDSSMEIIPGTIEQKVLEEENITQDAPDGTQYCLLYLNTSGVLKQEDFNIKLQSFDKSTEIDNYIAIEGNPAISLSVPYRKIRPLPAPTNITAVDQQTSLVITWDVVLGAEDYIVYLEDQVLEIVKTNRLELFREIRGNISIRAINDLTQSPLSAKEFIHSVPRNPFIIYIDNRYENNQYHFDVTFKDNSELETSYKLKYVIDDREEETVELPGYEGTGTLVKGSFSTVAVDQKVRARVLAVNEQGENEVAPFIEMRMPPEITWAYKDDSQQLVVSWLNTFPESELYMIRYREEGAEHISTQMVLNEYSENSRITTYIPLARNRKMEVSLAATVREDLPHIFSKPITCSSDKDMNLIAPTDFKSRKLLNNQVEFSWMDNHEVEEGWELAVTLNNTKSETIYIPSTTSHSIGTRQSYVYTFPEYGFMDAKLRMKWMLGTSNYTDSITNYYFEIDNRPPTNVARQYWSGDTIKFTWEAQGYVKQYMFNIKKVDDEEFTTYYNTAPEFYLNDFEEVEYIYNVKTEFLGEVISEPTQDFKFKPTVLKNTNCRLMTNKDSTTNHFVERTYTETSHIYPLYTKSIKQGTEIDYPIFMNSTTQFTMANGLVATETWGVGQEFYGATEMSIATTAVACNSLLDTISYQAVEDRLPLTTTIVTPDSTSYKVEMEVNKTRIVCFGDSITAGHPGYWAESGTGDIEHSYPYWLDRRLKFKYEVINKGYGSDRTTELMNRIDKDVIALNPQYCLIQIGTNDLYWGAASANGNMEAMEDLLTKMKNNIKWLVEKCVSNDIKPILGLLIPRTQVVTDELVRYGLYSFNDWLIEYANTTEGLNYVDFFNAGKDAIPPTPLEDPDSPGAMNPIYDGDNIYDEMGNLVQYGAGIHLNRDGYKIMAEAIPLNLFNDYSSGLKMFIDKDCTVEAEYNIDDKQNPYYKVTVEAMQLTRTKKIVRYIKNMGVSQTLFAMYPTKTHNLKFSFKTDEMENAEQSAYGILTAGKSIAVIIELTPQTEDSKAEFELSLVGREFTINS